MSAVNRVPPGHKMPSKAFKLAAGGETCIASIKPGCVAKLVVVYRGQFCPFCKVRSATTPREHAAVGRERLRQRATYSARVPRAPPRASG